MATETKNPSAKDAPASAGAAAAGPAGPVSEIAVETRPRKRKYSRGLKDAQRWERGVTKASRRLGRAVASGLDSYFDRREQSSYKKRDGAIRDALKNWSKAASKTLRKASNAPYDVAKGLDTRSVRRMVKFATRSLALPFLR